MGFRTAGLTILLVAAAGVLYSGEAHESPDEGAFRYLAGPILHCPAGGQSLSPYDCVGGAILRDLPPGDYRIAIEDATRTPMGGELYFCYTEGSCPDVAYPFCGEIEFWGDPSRILYVRVLWVPWNALIAPCGEYTQPTEGSVLYGRL